MHRTHLFNFQNININYLNLILILLISVSASSGTNTTSVVKCEPLNLTDGEVTCTSPFAINIRKVNKCKEPQDIGTIATYKCKSHFIFYNTGVNGTGSDLNAIAVDTQENELKCGQNGQWIGHKKFKSYGCREDCGSRLTNPRPLVVNGVPTNSSTWPWHAAIFKKVKGYDPLYICGGSIIKNSAILTAAHCVSSTQNAKIETESFVVVLGTITHIFADNQNNSNIQIFGVKKIYVSESYDEKKEYQGDIAIFQLKGTIKYTDRISPVCLPNHFTGDLNVLKPGKTGDVVGFGVDETNTLSHTLKHVQLEVKPHSECYVRLQRILGESQFCAGNQIGEKWVTVCNGDSGGGLVAPSIALEKYSIHGIVSTGDSNVRVGVCQNYAVFTRVFSFIGWIRNILEEISGKVALELDSTLGIPFTLKARENRRITMNLIPREWKNRVTSIQLSNVDIDPEILIDSLEYSKTILSINFTRVKFTSRFPRFRVRLPYLKSISMDILRDDLNISDEDRTVPAKLVKEFLPSLIFFDKDIIDDGEPGQLNRIGSLNTNIGITLHIFKLIHISHDEGKISLAQLGHEVTNQILVNTIQNGEEFNLKHLALSRTSLTNSTIQMLKGQIRVESLILDEVELEGQGQGQGQLLKNYARLKEFVWINPTHMPPMQINANEIPSGLKHLALTRATLTFPINIEVNLLETPSSPRPSAILFPNEIPMLRERLINKNLKKKTSQLETLFCDSCLPNESNSFVESIRNLNTVFPALKQLVLVLDIPVPSTKSLLEAFQEFKELESVFIKSKEDRFIVFSVDAPNDYLVHIRAQGNDKRDIEFVHFDYVLNRRQNFWSGEGDYVALKRLTAYQTIAYETGHYKFDSGALHPSSGYFELQDPQDRFQRIPSRIQDRLETVELNNIQFTKGDVFASLSLCRRLKRLILVNASAPSIKATHNVIQKSELPKLEEYHAEIAFIDPWTILGYHGFSLVQDTLLLYYFPWKLESEQRVTPNFQFRTNLFQSRIKKIYIQHGPCVQVSWDAKKGKIASLSNHTNGWLQNAIKGGVVIKEFSLSYWELVPENIPDSLEYLNLNFVVLKNIHALFERIRIGVLKTLILVNIRASDNNPDNFREWVRPIVNWAHLAERHSSSLEYIVFERIHFRGFRTGIVFEKVKVAYFEGCTFEADFVREFPSIFPNVERLVIAGGTAVDGFLLVQAAKIQTLKWILSTTVGFGDNERLKDKMNNAIFGSSVRKELKLKEEGKYFIVEKMESGNWVQTLISDTEVNNELEVLKRINDFGTDIRCHALTFPGGIQQHSHVKWQ